MSFKVDGELFFNAQKNLEDAEEYAVKLENQSNVCITSYPSGYEYQTEVNDINGRIKDVKDKITGLVGLVDDAFINLTSIPDNDEFKVDYYTSASKYFDNLPEGPLTYSDHLLKENIDAEMDGLLKEYNVSSPEELIKLLNRKDIVIPGEYGNSGSFTYTVLTDFNWAYDQKKVYEKWTESGSKDNNGIATIDGRYLIACTTTFGNVGDKVDFYLEDGTKIEGIIMDAKSQQYTSYDHNPANKWGHKDGQQIVEFEIVTVDSLTGKTGSVGTKMGWDGKRVCSATNLADNIIYPTAYTEFDKDEDE